MSTHIDHIWASLKDSSTYLTPNVSRKAKSIAHLWETKQPCQSKKKKERRSNDSKNFSKNPTILIGSKIVDKEEESKGHKDSPNQEIPCMDSPFNGLSTQITSFGDSDDESDDEILIDHRRCVVDEEENSPILTLQRIVSLMQSEVLQDRLNALKTLYTLVKSFHDKIDSTVSILNFPPPYDLTRITLTHQQHDALISDMAKGDHVKVWARWQRTQIPVLKQFFEDNEQEGILNGEQSSSDLSNKTRKDRTDAGESLQRILDFCGPSLFRRINDKSEVCRSYAINSIKLFCLSQIDIGKHLGFLMPVLLRKYPPMFFDDEMDIFIDDIDSHQFYKRGGAAERQDRTNLLSGNEIVKVLDPSEEIRLLLCELIACIIRCFVQLKTSTSLDAYFTDIIFAVQSHLKDPFPKLKITAANLLVQILRVPRWELGAKMYATAVARASIPNLRHRNHKVRVSSIYLFEASVSVPNREKIKGAGTEAIVDLVGFREENVLPIAAFYNYECGVTVNTLAELAIDKSTSVRLACCQMLSFLINCLPDRYDHHQRLLPYLLNFYYDDSEDIRVCANRAIEICGEQYEAEHPNEVIERRQYRVDGNDQCNHKETLPFPFQSRPRLGARLFVRANMKRFFAALLNELTSWTSKTRIQTAKLLCVLIVYCEEYLTMDCHNTIAGIVKAVQMNIKEPEKESKSLSVILRQILELMGRFIAPNTYIKILLPRAIGDVNSATTFAEGGTHSKSSCVANAIAIRSMIKGTLPKILLPCLFTLIPLLSVSLSQSEFEGSEVKIQWLLILKTILDRTENESISGAQSACFDATGRIHSSQEMIKKCQSSIQQIIENCSSEDDSVSKVAHSVMEQLLSIEMKD